MRTSVMLYLAAMVALVVAIPPPEAGAAGAAGAAPFIPSMAMIKSFIPTAEEIAALQALHPTTPAPGAAPTTPAAGPTAPPTMPPAVASLVKKYQAAAAAFAPMAPAPV